MHNKQLVTVLLGRKRERGGCMHTPVDRCAYRDQNAALSTATFLPAEQGQ